MSAESPLFEVGSAEPIANSNSALDAVAKLADEPNVDIFEDEAASGTEPGRRGPRAGSRDVSETTLIREGDIAADYLEELLDIADLPGNLDMDVEGDRAVVSVEEEEPGSLIHLVGEEGEVLDALQELTRLAVLAETGERSRLMLDIAGHRAALRRQLVALAQQMCGQVERAAGPVSLRSMTAFERKVVHDAVAAAGFRSESEGVEPNRFVVVYPA